MGREVTVGRGLPAVPAAARRRSARRSLVASGLAETPSGAATRRLEEALLHASDCSRHNAPAFEPGPCDCGALVADGAPVFDTSFILEGSLAMRRYFELLLENGYHELASDSWPCDVGTLGDIPNAVFRDGEEAVVVVPPGILVYARMSFDWFVIRCAAPTDELAGATCSAFRQVYPASYLTRQDNMTPITFWTLGRHGPNPRLRRLASATWGTIEGNYPGALRAELGELMAWSGPEREGQLFVWQGPPGTGKSWALRALSTEWAPWAEFHYITDPDAFFVKDPSYMIDVLLSDSYSAIDSASGRVYEEEDPLGKWRVLILEDTGELLAANAKEAYGQGLSRLLNVVDGMIGQGLRVLAVLTTNDELGDLAPAAVRPGRCASRTADGESGPTAFGAFPAAEASSWLGWEVSEDMSLAEMYAARAAAEAAPAQAFEADEHAADVEEPAPDPEEPEPTAASRSGAFAALREIARRGATPQELAPRRASVARPEPAAAAPDALQEAFSALKALASRETPAPTFHFHLPEHALDVAVHTPPVEVPVTVQPSPVTVPLTVEPAAVEVHLPQQAAPVVTVEPRIDVHVPEQEPAPVEAHVHVSPAPVAVTVEQPRPHAVRVVRSSDGSKVYIPEEVE